jgi:hypothetical protein
MLCMVTSMSPKTRYNFMIDPGQRDALSAIKAREGIPESELIRRAIAEYLARRGENKPERKRAVTRKRS